MGWQIAKGVWLPNFEEDRAIALGLIDIDERTGSSEPWMIEAKTCFESGAGVLDWQLKLARQTLKRHHGKDAGNWLSVSDEYSREKRHPYKKLSINLRRQVRKDLLDAASIIE